MGATWSSQQSEAKLLLRLYLAQVPYSMDEGDIRRVVEAVLPVQEVHLPRFPDSGKPRGIAFVTVELEHDRDERWKALCGMTVEGVSPQGKPVRKDLVCQVARRPRTDRR